LEAFVVVVLKVFSLLFFVMMLVALAFLEQVSFGDFCIIVDQFETLNVCFMTQLEF